MAGKKENIKALFSNTRSRVIILFTVILLLVTVIIGFVKFGSSIAPHTASGEISQSPAGINSIPGSQDQTAQYAALQETQNMEQAQKARDTGNSAIPTIIRTQAFGEGVDIIGMKEGEGGVGFTSLAREDLGGAQKSLWIQSLKETDCDHASIAKAVSQGAAAGDLKDACSCKDLKQYGFKIGDLEPVCTCAELRSAGFDIVQMKEAGFSAGRLRLCGFVACDEKGVGFTAQQMKDAGFSDGELKGAGFSEQAIALAGGVPDGMTIRDIKSAGCDSESLKRLKASGVSASAIRRISGCDVTQIKAADFNADDLKNAQFSAADLKQAGFNANQLKSAGFGPRDLLNAGFTGDDLAGAGFAATEIKAAQTILPLGLAAADVKKSGCSPEAIKRQRLASVGASAIKKYANCDENALKKGGFSSADLLNAGFKSRQINPFDEQAIRDAGRDPVKLKKLLDKGITAKQIQAVTGMGLDALKQAGLDVADLAFDEQAIRDAGRDPVKLKKLLDKGITAKQIQAVTGMGLDALKQAGLDVADLAFDEQAIRDAGRDPVKLKKLQDKGITAKQIQAVTGMGLDALKQAGLDVADLAFDEQAIRDAGRDPVKLKKLLDKGITAKQIQAVTGMGLDALKQAGLDAKTLADAGFTPQELLASGLTPQQLIHAGLSPVAVIASGRQTDCSVASLKTARELNVSAAMIKQTLGCAAKPLKEAGFSVVDLKNTGFTAAELNNAGAGVSELKKAGFNAKDLRAAGFTAQQLLTADFSPSTLKDAGFDALDLKNAGLSITQLKAAGLDANALHKAGFSAKQLKEAGFSADVIKQIGLSSQELKEAGFSVVGLDDTIATLPSVASTVTTLPSFNGKSNATIAAKEAANAKQLAAIRAQQNNQMAAQRYQQKIQQQTSIMLSAANQALAGWKITPDQTYIAGSEKEDHAKQTAQAGQVGAHNLQNATEAGLSSGSGGVSVIKTGDVLFAVIDTSVNSDEPGPILATIVSGKLKGARLIGSFNLPSNADEMVISFNTLSIPGADKTVSIKAYAIDPDTARTALSSQTDHHYLMRYGSLFAATFLEGFGNAFQSADTTITVGGTGGTTNTTVSNGIDRSLLENAVIGLATLGKAWGQVAAQQMSRPTTVEVFSGTGVGVLFTQDLKLT